MPEVAKIFSPDTIKTRICQAVSRDIASNTSVYGGIDGSTKLLRERLVKEIDKKYTSVSRDPDLRLFAFMKFLETNIHMADYDRDGIKLPDDLSPMKPQTRYTPRERILLRARAICRSVLGPLSEDDWFHCCKHGTGSSIGVPFQDTSLEAKSTLPISVTARAAPILQRYMSFNSQLMDAVISFNDTTPFGEWYHIVEGSRATTVPKSNKIDRMIAVEPTGNMLLQQGLMVLMYGRLKRYGLDLEVLPTQHKRRARLASITSLEATIDWSSASDCVGIELLRWLLPPIWFECLDMVRSTHITIDGVPVELNMFSTMGNADTFPLETLVFWSLAQAVYLEHQGTLSSLVSYEDRLVCSVFGDDCIVPTTIANDFIQVMESVGFIPNREKSFIGNERFRESCGGDYYRGYDVRPFNLRAPTSNRKSALEPWLYIIGNRLISKYISCFGTRNYMYAGGYFLRTLFDCFEEHDLKIKVVPDDYPDDAGLKIAFDLERFTANFDPKYQDLKKSQHGLYSFLFCRFKYWQREEKFEELHYVNWLNRPAITPEVASTLRSFRRTARNHGWLRVYCHRQLDAEPASLFRSKKDRGGYIVAKGYTVHWTVPDLHKVRAQMKRTTSITAVRG